MTGSWSWRAIEFAGNPNDAFEYIWALAIGYDWLFTWSGFSETDKGIVRAKLVERTAQQVNETGLNGFPDFPTGPETSKSIYDNMSTENNMASGFAGLVLWEAGDPYGTNADAQRFLDATYYRFREMYAATRAHAPDGGYWEGQGYYGARLQGEVYFALTWLVATGEDLLADNEHLQNAVYYWIYGLRPDGLSSREGDQTCLPRGAPGTGTSPPSSPRTTGTRTCSGTHSTGARWLGEGWEEVALYDAGVRAQPPSTLPLHRRFQFGHIVIRTGWNIGPGSDDTYFTFDIHDWVSGHTHVDSGSFTLFRRGALAIDSGRYRGGTAAEHAHERNYATRTVAHNTITVYRAGEDFGGFANDGGQGFLFQEPPTTEPRFVADLAAGTLFDAGTLEAFEAAADHYYLKGNATDAYHSTGFQRPSDGAAAKISHFTREIAFFPDEPDPLVVVFDRVTSLQAGWPKRWLLHAIDEPQVSGPVTSTEVPGHILTHNGDLVTIDRAGRPAVLAHAAAGVVEDPEGRRERVRVLGGRPRRELSAVGGRCRGGGVARRGAAAGVVHGRHLPARALGGDQRRPDDAGHAADRRRHGLRRRGGRSRGPVRQDVDTRAGRRLHRRIRRTRGPASADGDAPRPVRRDPQWRPRGREPAHHLRRSDARLPNPRRGQRLGHVAVRAGGSRRHGPRRRPRRGQPWRELHRLRHRDQ